MTIKRRLARLETLTAAKAAEQHIVFVTHHEAGPDDPNCKTGGIYEVIVFSYPGSQSEVFKRLPGEAEDALLYRAGARIGSSPFQPSRPQGIPSVAAQNHAQQSQMDG